MITLLLALFIILYSVSAVDAEKFTEISKNMNAALNTPQAAAGQASAAGADAAKVENTLDKIASEINTYLEENDLDHSLQVTKTSDFVKLSIKDSLFFSPNESNLLPGSDPLIREVAQVLQSVYGGIDHITISGHTADVGTETMTAWKLSSDRAIAVLSRLVDNGMEQGKFSVEGNSHYKPVAPNDTKANMAKNRRVEITITKNAANGGLITVDS